MTQEDQSPINLLLEIHKRPYSHAQVRCALSTLGEVSEAWRDSKTSDAQHLLIIDLV